ncbi:uncharacterized protein BCR38DRAFT_397957 [Pseudomassariella vexata]|uniref:Hemerythrin-like domain-containing protein n=1 Tax=Pseudomassariella vexata TaxID=1141098 RepID=A0A1Y2DKZ1_9PEZI|nr:uncharacterized protein BCR38DRAFT_397957 [Pseudomassariella vexata]ORY59958.1 hypothetical protein BCR38DRAFT_397957 [Pseudomassariella vexata]
MFRRAARPISPPKFGIVSLRPKTVLQVLGRNFADYHFPGERTPALEHSQIWKLSQAIQHDHHRIEESYHKMVNSNDSDQQQRYQNLFIWELARLAIAKELVVYPVLERNIPGGRERVEKDRASHQLIKEQLKQFQKLKPGDKEFIPSLASLFKGFQIHVEGDEEQNLSKLEEALTLTESKELCQSFEKTKYFVPSRSHPMAPNKPPFDNAAAFLAAPIDKLRDLFRKWPDSRPQKKTDDHEESKKP